MTVIEIIDLARDLANEPLSNTRTFPDDSSSFFEDTKLLSFFNREQQVLQGHIIEAFEHYFVTSTSIDIVNGTDEYSLTSGVIKIVRMEWVASDPDDPQPILPISFNEKDRYQGINIGITGASDMSVYALKGNSVVFRPFPRNTIASAVKYHYVQKLPDMAASTATAGISLIPEQWHEAMAWGIYKRMLVMQEGSTDSYTLAAAEYQNWINNMKQWAENRQIQRPRQVKRRKFWRQR